MGNTNSDYCHCITEGIAPFVSFPYDNRHTFLTKPGANLNFFSHVPIMKPLETSVLKTIYHYDLVADDSAILVAVSGGPDSTALLSILKNLVPDAVKAAVYIDHKLRPEEVEAEISHLGNLCRSYGISFDRASVDVQSVRMSNGESPEASARRLRFDALNKMMLHYGTDLLALGHTSDDQVEEVLIRLIRGSGMNGLSGMRHRNGHIIRPLLSNSKQEVLDYLSTENIPYCVDSSNTSRTFLRNKVRLDLIPLLEQDFNPSIRKTILNSAAILKDEDSYLDEVTKTYYQTLVTDKQQTSPLHTERSYQIEAFQAVPISLRRRLLEKLFWKSSCRPTFQSIEEVIYLSEQGRTGTTIHFSGGLRVIKTAEEIIFSSRLKDRNLRHRNDETYEVKIIIERTGVYNIPQLDKALHIVSADERSLGDDTKLAMDGGKAIFPLTLRSHFPGETFHPFGAPGKKKVARFLSDKKVPRHERHRYPVLVSPDHSIVAIPGLAISETAKITANTTQIVEIYWKAMGELP